MPKEPPKRPPVRIILKKPEEKSQFETNSKLPKKEITGSQLSDQPGSYETSRLTPQSMSANLTGEMTQVKLHQSSRARDVLAQETPSVAQTKDPTDAKGPSLLRLFVKAYAPSTRSTLKRDRGGDGLER